MSGLLGTNCHSVTDSLTRDLFAFGSPEGVGGAGAAGAVWSAGANPGEDSEQKPQDAFEALPGKIARAPEVGEPELAPA